MPYHCDDDRVNRWALETLDELLHNVAGSSASTGDSFVEIVPTLCLKRNHHGPSVQDYVYNDDDAGGGGGGSPLPKWTSDPRLAFQHLTVEMLFWQNEVLKLRIPSQAELVEAGYMHGWLFRPPIVDAPRMLRSMLTEVELHPLAEDIDVDTGKDYESLQEMVEDAKSMGCDAVVNCTGLGSGELCGDDELVGGRGVLVHYDRTCERRSDAHGGRPMPNDVAILCEEPPYGSETEPCYLIPRGNVIVVGGTYLEGDLEPALRPEERKRLEKNAYRLGIDTDASRIVNEWTGFRPYRPTVRLEVDPEAGAEQDVTVVHNYGHGGSGWTVFAGAAREVALLLGHAKQKANPKL